MNKAQTSFVNLPENIINEIGLLAYIQTEITETWTQTHFKDTENIEQSYIVPKEEAVKNDFDKYLTAILKKCLSGEQCFKG
jgi:hypothetical protein